MRQTRSLTFGTHMQGQQRGYGVYGTRGYLIEDMLEDPRFVGLVAPEPTINSGVLTRSKRQTSSPVWGCSPFKNITCICQSTSPKSCQVLFAIFDHLYFLILQQNKLTKKLTKENLRNNTPQYTLSMSQIFQLANPLLNPYDRTFKISHINLYILNLSLQSLNLIIQSLSQSFQLLGAFM
jgi:hypothetical protein